MTLAPIFSPDPSDWAPPLLVPAAPSSWRHQCFASAMQCPRSRRIQPSPLSTGPRIRPPSATPESGHGSRLHYQSALPVTPSIGSPCAVHTRCLQTPAARPWACGLHPLYAYSCALRCEPSSVAVAQHVPTTRPSPPTTAPSFSPASLSPSPSLHAPSPCMETQFILITDKFLV